MTPASTVSGTTGINASAIGTGTVTVTTAAGAGGNVTGTANSGIVTSAVNGNATLTVNSTVTGTGTGNAGVTSTATGTGNNSLIVAAGSTVTGGLTASGARLSQTGTGSNIITNSGLITGPGTAADPIISSGTTNAGTTTITNNVGAIIQSTGAAAAQPGDLAIFSPVLTGAYNVTNAGLLRGRIGLTSGADTVTNSGTWTVHEGGAGVANAAANFGLGVDSLVNSGTINAGNALNATFATNFLGIENITNTATGVVNAGLFAGSVTNFATPFVQTTNNVGIFNVTGALNFTGAGGSTVTNTGVFNMQTATGVTTDTTTFNVAVGVGAASNAYTPGVAYNWVGGAGSTVRVNANVGNLGSSGSTVPSDRLLISGSTTGRTGIAINNTNTGFGSYNPTGITIVGVNGATNNNFVLSSMTGGGPSAMLQSSRGPNGAIKNGAFFYPLLMTSGGGDGIGTEYRLFGLPDVELFQLPVAVTGAQTLFYDTAADWQARQNDLRKYAVGGGQSAGEISAAPGYYAPRGNGVWMKASGGFLSANRSQSLSNYAPAAWQMGNVDTSYNQNTYSLVVGADYSFEDKISATDTITIGAMAGYVNSTLSFKSSPTTYTYTGATFGLSATYLKNGWFADALLKADILSIGMNFPSLAGTGFSSTTVDGRNLGGITSAGYRFDFAKWYIEPSVTLAYVSTTIENFSGLGMNVNFNNGQDFRGALGGQVGTVAMQTDNALIDLSLTAKVWDQFVSTNSVVVGGAGAGLTMNDPHSQVFGEIVGSFSYYSKDSPWSGFVNAGGKFNDQFWAINAMAGGRYKF